MALDAGERLDRAGDWLVLVVGLMFAAYIRFIFHDFESQDFALHTSRWYAAVQDAGLGATATDVSNYTPTYLYLLNAVSLVLPDLAAVSAVKIPSLFFDVACAFMVMLIVRLRYPGGREPLLAFLAVLLSPTVVIDGAVWGQADSIYSSFLLLCVYGLMTGRSVLAMIAFGLALSLKFQTMFLAPAIFALWLKRRVSWWTPLLVLPVYALVMVPAWLEGRSFAELATVYLNQSQTFERLTMDAPNLYAWIPNAFYSPAVIAGLLLMTALACLLAWRVWQTHAKIDQALILRLCLLSLLMTPYFLPKMHDRFFYPADVLAIAYAFHFPRHFYVPVLITFCSCVVYGRFLLDVKFLPLRGLALVMFIAVFAVAYATWRDLRREPGATAKLPA